MEVGPGEGRSWREGENKMMRVGFMAEWKDRKDDEVRE